MQQFFSAFGGNADVLNINQNTTGGASAVGDIPIGAVNRESQTINVLVRRQCHYQAITNALNSINQNGNLDLKLPVDATI